jgi:hypothetical protein
VPGGGIEPPTRGFSIEMTINSCINTISCMSLKLVCEKVCFCFYISAKTIMVHNHLRFQLVQ